MSSPAAVVIGVGPGLGSAVARRFARHGLSVGLVARGRDKLDPVREEIESKGGRALAVPADATDPESIGSALEQVTQTLGPVDVLVYNAGAFKMAAVTEITPEDFDACWKANCAGAFYASRVVVPSMVERGRGTILLTGATASRRGGANFACLSVGKFGLRALAESMARELAPKGVHVAHVVIDGQIDLPRTRAMFPDRPTETFLSPDAIAETYLQLHEQDPTAWTLELELRPKTEKF